MTELLPVAVRAHRGRPRTTGGHVCDRCSRSTAKIRVRWPDGRICGTCFHDAVRTYGCCDSCSEHRMLPGRAPGLRLCRGCAGITTDLDCHRCGVEGEHHRRGLCARCTLREDLSTVLQPAGVRARPELVRLIDALATADRPESIHTWKRNPKTLALLTSLGDGTLALDHEALDSASPGLAREHLRHLLVHHGLLPHRDPDLARFEAWLADRLSTLTDPLIRRPIEQFATWHHLRRVRGQVRAGTDARAAVAGSKQDITEAGRFLDHLAQHGRTIAECTQTDLDEWLAGGPTSRHLVRTFIVWAGRQHLAPRLTIGFRQPCTSPLISQGQRLEWVRQCLTGQSDTLAYRVAAALLLLYAQPLVRVARLRTDQIQATKDGLRIKLGPEPAAVPEPFAQLLREHLEARPNMRTGNTGGSPWLFASSRAGAHLNPGTIAGRLRELGIDLRGTRNAAIRALVLQVPVPIVATQLGYSQATAHRHAALAAQPMARYVALRNRQLIRDTP